MGLDFKEFVSGVGLIALSFFLPTGAPAWLPYALRLAGSQLVGASLAPDRALEDRQQGRLAQSTSTTNALPIVYGTARVAGKLVYHDTQDISVRVVPGFNVDVTPLPNDLLDVVSCLCLATREPVGGETDSFWQDGQIAGFGAIFLDDRKIIDADQPNDATSTADGGIQPDPDADNSAFAGTGAWLTHVNRHYGGWTQDADNYMVTTYGSADDAWTTNHRLRGVAYLVASVYMQDDLGYPPGSPPPNITAIIKGRRVYDPRVAIWGHTDNWALCVRDYLLDPIAGAAVDIDLLDEDSFTTEADVSDEVIVDSDAGTALAIAASAQSRYTVNGVVDTSQSVLTNLSELLDTAHGALIWESGQFKLKRITAENPLSDLILDENIIIGTWTLGTSEPQQRANLVIADYVDASDYDADEIKDQIQQVQYPAADDTNTYLDEDQGFEVPRRISLPYVTTELAAKNRAQSEIEFQRADLTISVTAKERALGLSVLDRVRLDHDRFSLAEREFYVLGMGLNPDNTVQLGLRVVEAGCLNEADEEKEPEEVPATVTVTGGAPLENVGALERAYIGIVTATLDISTVIFNASTSTVERELAGADMLSEVGIDMNQHGHGMAYIPSTNEVWQIGDPQNLEDNFKVAVYDARTGALVDGFTIPELHARASEANGCEYNPVDGLLYVAASDGDSGDGETFHLAAIDPSSRRLIQRYEINPDPDEDPTGVGRPWYIWIDTRNGDVSGGTLRDHIHKFSPLTVPIHPDVKLMDDTPSGPVGGLIDDGTFVSEGFYNPDDTKVYIVSQGQSDIWTYDEDDWAPSTNEAESALLNPTYVTKWLDFDSTDDDPGAMHTIHVPSIEAIAVSRHNSPPVVGDTEPGRVSIYSRRGSLLRDVRLDFAPGRMAYLERIDSIVVVSDHDEHSDTLIRVIPIAGSYNLPPDGTDPGGGSSGGGASDPNEPILEPTPASVDSSAPEITAGGEFCTDSMSETSPGSEEWTGDFDAGFFINYTDAPDHPGVSTEVRAWAPGSDPSEPPMFLETGYSSGGQVVTFDLTFTDSVSTRDKPTCGNPDRDRIDQFLDVRVRHEGVSGGFGGWSNKIAIRVHNPEAIATAVDPSDPLPDSTDVDSPYFSSFANSFEQICVGNFGEDSPGAGTYSGYFRVSGKVTAFASKPEDRDFQMEFAEMTVGEHPDSDTPLRTKLAFNDGPISGQAQSATFQHYQFGPLSSQAVSTTPSCATDLADTTEAFDYYARFVIDQQNGTYSAWSAAFRGQVDYRAGVLS